MNTISKFALYGLLGGAIYSIFAMGPFLFCNLTGIGTSSGSGGLNLNYCTVNFLLKPFAVFYFSLARGKGLFFTATNFKLIGEVFLILLAFIILGTIIGTIVNWKQKNKAKLCE